MRNIPPRMTAPSKIPETNAKAPLTRALVHQLISASITEPSPPLPPCPQHRKQHCCLPGRHC